MRLPSDSLQPAAPPARQRSSPNDRAAGLARGWPARRKINRAAEARYTQIVQALKIALPLLALLIVVTVVIYSGFSSNDTGIVVTPAHLDNVGDDLRMVNPRLSGVDGAQRPYTVTAEYAEQQKGRPDLIRLVNIEADVTLESNQWLSLTAKTGLLDGDKRTLTLDGGISAFSDSGYELHTEKAIVNFEEGKIIGPSPVKAQGPLGTINANGFEVLQDLKQVKFLEKVQTVYTPEARAPGAADGFEPLPEETEGSPEQTPAETPSAPQP
jgi:lipopolysaccharide export system protein LptC